MKNSRQSYIKKNLWLRAQIIQAVRTFFIDNDYLEIETPCRIPAPTPEAHIEAEVSGDWFLHTSPELCMKRLFAAGYPRIFQICRCFRQKERGSKHLPEMTMLEWYTSGHNYFNMMEQCEELIRFVARRSGFENFLVYQGNRIDLNAPWSRISVTDAFEMFSSVSMETAVLQDRFDQLTAFDIEPNLGRKKPLFLYDYPAAAASLARLKPGNRSLAERFELYISGLELCNAFSELTDPVEQRTRFENEQKNRSKFGLQAYPLPEKYLDSLQLMPEGSGIALGIDRLVMLFANTDNIDDVVAFTPEEL
ncbi:MAG: EF-P lysine aminoacylase EpmA [Thermodesulfobacteriota bacterium]|nr:EF-P lysine aminoacylase EpmA [Thermodesulfobacteriota bacterium]